MRLASPFASLAGRWLSLPPPRCRAVRSDEWVRMRDGARIPAAVFRPEGEIRSTLLARSIAPIHGLRQPLLVLAQALAEQGHAVVVAGIRGLHRAEGRFAPFSLGAEHGEDADGADVLDWIAGEPWSAGPQALYGFGYAGYAAWATLSAARRTVDALAVGFCARDPYAWLYHGGALQLEAAFDLALALAQAEPEGVRRGDLPRALVHRPLRDADRVASRRIDWLRDWLAHPERDAYWEPRRAPLPQRPPETLLIGGWYHATLPAMLADHAELAARAEVTGAEAPRLRVGPWAATPLPRGERDRAARVLRETAGALARLLERLCGEDGRVEPPVRAFVPGAGWRTHAHWPPDVVPRELALEGSGRDPERGSLRWEGEAAAGVAPSDPAAPSEADAYLYDPADAASAYGGTSLAQPGEAPAPDAPGRGDALRYTTDPLPRALEIAGSPRAILHVESSARHTDFAATLARVRPDGAVHHLASGLARVVLEGPSPSRIEIALWPLWQRLAAGDRLRLEVSSSCFPRFDRHPNRDLPPAAARDEDGVVARQRVHHDAQHPSALVLPCVPA